MCVTNTFPRGSELLKENLGIKYEMFIYKLLVVVAQKALEIIGYSQCFLLLTVNGKYDHKSVNFEILKPSYRVIN